MPQAIDGLMLCRAHQCRHFITNGAYTVPCYKCELTSRLQIFVSIFESSLLVFDPVNIA